MKHLLSSLIATLLLAAGSAPAQLYPVLTDTSARTFPGGVTNVFFLNSNAVATGTFRATGAVTLTNSGNVFAGDGSGLTGINGGVPTLNGNATNLSVYSSGTTNRPLRVYGTNGESAFFDKDGNLLLSNGSGSAPALGFINVPNSGLYYPGFGQMAFTVAGTPTIGIESGSLNLWSATAAWGTGFGGTKDTGLSRSSAGVVEVNTSTSGVFRDLVARSIYATNLYTTNLVINGGATVAGILSATATLDFNLTAVDVEDLTITVTGAAVGNVVSLGVPHGSVTATAQFTGWVSAADTVTVRCRVAPGAAENPASGTFRATVIKH